MTKPAYPVLPAKKRLASEHMDVIESTLNDILNARRRLWDMHDVLNETDSPDYNRVDEIRHKTDRDMADIANTLAGLLYEFQHQMETSNE